MTLNGIIREEKMKFLQENIKLKLLAFTTLLFTSYYLGVIQANFVFQGKLDEIEERQLEISKLLDATEEKLNK